MDRGNDDPVQTGRTILTALYLCMLGVCFLVPIFFYFRMHCDERRNRHLRDLEIAGMAQAMNESQDLQREESRAARRKYREERRARILQLFTPVRMTLTEDNFVHSVPHEGGHATDENDEMAVMESGIAQRLTEIQDGVDKCGASCSTNNGISINSILSLNSCPNNSKGGCIGNEDTEDFILIPKPGLPHGASIHEFNSNSNSSIISTANSNDKINKKQEVIKLRRVPNECSICLCEYTVGSNIVWSSNPQCEHVFHTECIEQWLMRQRDGPLCPCCRRDFVIDPFDFGLGEMDDFEKAVSTTLDSSVGDATTNAPRANDMTTLREPPIADNVEETVAAMILAASFDAQALNAPTQLAADDSDPILGT